MKQYLLNPFIKIAGEKALFYGWAILLVTAVVAVFSNCHFDSVLSAHTGMVRGGAWVYFIDAVIVWALPVICFYLAGRIASPSSFRLIDIAGTMALARWPMLVVALLFFIPVPLPPAGTLDIKLLLPAVILGFSMLPFVAWMVILMFQAYKVSTGLKGSRCVVSFILALIVAEILASVIFYFFYNSL